jgi:hypothetical protein
MLEYFLTVTNQALWELEIEWLEITPTENRRLNIKCIGPVNGHQIANTITCLLDDPWFAVLNRIVSGSEIVICFISEDELTESE